MKTLEEAVESWAASQFGYSSVSEVQISEIKAILTTDKGKHETAYIKLGNYPVERAVRDILNERER